MATVAEAVKVVSIETGEPEPFVSQIARNLINNGILPKNVGKRFSRVDETNVAMLLLGLYTAPKIAEASQRAQQYAALRWGGEPDDMTFGSFLARALNDLHTRRDVSVRINQSITVPYNELRIEIVTTYPVAGVSMAPHFGVPAFEGSINFADTPKLANYWPSTKPRRSVTIPGDTLFAIVNRLFGFVDHFLDQDPNPET